MGKDPDIISKKQQTMVRLHGVSHPMQSKEFKQKQKDTVIDRYGVDNPSKSSTVKSKMKETFLKKYGVDNPSKSPIILEKIQKDAIERYATEKDSILSKRRQTSILKFGHETNKHQHISKQSIALMKDISWLNHQHFDLKKSVAQIAEELGVSPTPILGFFSKNNIKVQKQNESKTEKQLVEYLKSKYSNTILTHDRSIIAPNELDIVLPEKSIAIEVDGVYWHSEEKGKNQNYHLNKTLAAETNNIHLLHIYDAEWNDTTKQQIIKSKLDHLLGLSQRIFARKCTVVELNSTKDFLDQNHLQGNCAASVKLGLISDNELVAVVSFGKARFNKKYSWELLRYSNKIGVSVVGGLSKLIAYAMKNNNITSLISYADRRWSTTVNNNLYHAAGFRLIGTAAPNYKYFKCNNFTTLLSRNQFQKHMLKDKLEFFDANLTEYENMSANGYYRIWDCGNLVYEWKN